MLEDIGVSSEKAYESSTWLTRVPRKLSCVIGIHPNLPTCRFEQILSQTHDNGPMTHNMSVHNISYLVFDTLITNAYTKCQ